jgi:nitroreductase/Pyruvate/2-oxoacid:ferredoxin oxidoreductase delta subunit
MAIPTTRTAEAGQITIDYARCNGCGLCVDVCADFEYKIIKGKVVPSGTGVFGCIACGQCMAICPEDAIKINGRTLSPEDLFLLAKEPLRTDYPRFLTLLQNRRSIRKFKDQEVPEDTIEKIIGAARTAPMGIPPSDVSVLVIKGKERGQRFVLDFCTFLQSQRWMVSGWFLALMRPFWGKTNDKLFRDFIRPLINTYVDSMKKGDNVVTYDAPLTLYFYGSPYSDPADPVIAATYAMLAAESLGLGTCMIGGIHPFLQHGGAATKFRKKYGIRYKSQAGLFVILGYPKVKFGKGIRRTFANVDQL